MLPPTAPGSYEVTIVGGGPAGMSAALLLGRCLRRVLICDDGKPRNAAAETFHVFLSRDDSSPEEFRRISRAQLARYPNIEWRDERVTEVRRVGDGFCSQLTDGSQIWSRVLLLAQGLVDELPDVAGLARFYGKSVHSCPYCDGWEKRGQRTAVLGGDESAAELALEMRTWTDDIVLCSHGPPQWDAEMAARLERASLRVCATPVAELEGKGSQLRGLRFVDGDFLPREVLYFSPRQRQRSNFAEQLGCDFEPTDDSICCDGRGATCIPGLYAAGNSSRGVQLVIVAAAEGALAAMAINEALEELRSD